MNIKEMIPLNEKLLQDAAMACIRNCVGRFMDRVRNIPAKFFPVELEMRSPEFGPIMLGFLASPTADAKWEKPTLPFTPSVLRFVCTNKKDGVLIEMDVELTASLIPCTGFMPPSAPAWRVGDEN